MTTLTQNSTSRDFDFMVGSWTVHNHFLNQRLCGSNLWVDFEATYDLELLLNGLGNIDHFHAVSDGRPIEGITVRLYDPKTGEWTLYWGDNVRPGKLLPPMVGKFEGDVGEFYGEEELNGRPVLCRFRWFRTPAEPPRWEQAFSGDGGKTWETNWIMTFTREK